MAPKQNKLRRLKAQPLEPSLARVVRKEMKATGTPGAAVGVLYRGKAYAQGFGVTNVDTPAKVDEETLFQVGSTGKTFTAAAAMRLVEQGELDLNAPVRRYLRDLKLRDAEVTRRVTLRHLLTHTAGWAGDFFHDSGRGDDALSQTITAMRTLPQLTPLGEVWHYNNAAFYLTGRLIEKVYGKPYELAIKELLLDPLGMTKSFFFTEEAILHRVAVGHTAERRKQVTTQNWWLRRGMSPAGGLVSDVLDQLRWASFNLGDGKAPDGKRLLKKSTMNQMQKPQEEAGNLADWVGYSWLLEDVGGTRLVSHGGTTVGQLSAFTMVPSKAFAVTSMTNSTSGRSVNRAVVKWALEHYADVVRSTPETVSVNGSELKAYEGRYLEAFKRLAFDVEPTGRRLASKAIGLSPETEGLKLPPFHLAFFDDDRAVQTDGELKGLKVEFLRDGRNRVAWMRFGGRLYKRTAIAPRTASRSKKKKRA